MNFDRADIWTKKSWMDEFTSDPRVAKDLTSIYADDVIEGLEAKDYANLDDALAQLKDRVGLTTADANTIKRIVHAKLNPEVAAAEERIKHLSKKDLGELIKEATSEKPTLSKHVAAAVNNIGLETIAEMYDSFGSEEVAAEETSTESASENSPEGEVDLDAQVAQENSEEALAEAAAASELLKKAGELPEGLKNYLEKKKGNKPEESKEEDDSEEEDKEATASVDTADAVADATSDSSDGDGCGCGKSSCDCQVTASDDSKTSTAKMHDEEHDEDEEDDDDDHLHGERGGYETDEHKASYQERIIAAAKKKKKSKSKKKTHKKKNMKVNKKKVDKKKWNKKKMKMNKKCAENWENFLSQKGWFQGADQAPMDPNTSNDPEKLGYPKEVSYSNKTMQVPVGEDSRPWEQDWFEDAADETKKDLGPSGEELKLKKMWQRAKYKAFMKKYIEAKEKGLLSKEANPAEFLMKKKRIDLALQKEKENSNPETTPTEEGLESPVVNPKKIGG